MFKQKYFQFAKFLSLIFCAMLILVSCTSLNKYDEDWIIGKTYYEVIEKYGDFDLQYSTDAQGVNCACGYLTGTNLSNLWEELPDEFFMIYFDDDGVAYRVEKNVPRPGG